MRSLAIAAIGMAGLCLVGTPASGQDAPEYRLKAAVLFNFVQYTEWPADVGDTLMLCVEGIDPFGKELDALHGKAVGARTLRVQPGGSKETRGGCQVMFIAASAQASLQRILTELRNSPTLTVAESPGAARQGAMINLAVAQNRITFEVNLTAARAARLGLSSKLLRLATEVHQ